MIIRMGVQAYLPKIRPAKDHLLRLGRTLRAGDGWQQWLSTLAG